MQEASVLAERGFTLAAVYLAGYAVECRLKALVLSTHPEHDQRQIEAEFRGQRAHSHSWLRTQYRVATGLTAPAEVLAAESALAGWGTALRYHGTTKYDDDVDEFFAAAGVVLNWCDRSL